MEFGAVSILSASCRQNSGSWSNRGAPPAKKKDPFLAGGGCIGNTNMPPCLKQILWFSLLERGQVSSCPGGTRVVNFWWWTRWISWREFQTRVLSVAHWSLGVYVKAVTGQRKPGRTSSLTPNPCILQRLWMTAEHIRVSLAVPGGVVFQGAWTTSRGVALPRPASSNAHFWAEHYGIFMIKRVRNAAFSWPSHDEPNPSYSWPSPSHF